MTRIVGFVGLSVLLAIPILIPACTPQQRAKTEADISYALTAEQVACLVAEHSGPSPQADADILLVCQVSQAVGSAVLSGLRLADARNDAGSVPVVTTPAPAPAVPVPAAPAPAIGDAGHAFYSPCQPTNAEMLMYEVQ